MKTLSILVLRWAACTAFALVCVAAPRSAQAQEPTLSQGPVDPNVVPPEGTRSRLLWTGAALTVGWYGASFGTSLVWQDSPRQAKWKIPVVGPWLSLGKVGCAENESGCDSFTLVLRTAFTLIASVGQAGGLLALGEGLLLDTTPRSGASSGPLVPPGATSSGAGIEWTTVPMADANGFGLEILGRF